MVWSPGAVSVEFRDVPRHLSFFSVIYMYISTLLAKYTEVDYQLKQTVLHEHKI